MTLPANQLGLEAAEISGSGLKKRSIDSVQVAGGEVSEASVRVSESSSSVAPNAAMKFGVESSSFLDSKSCEDFSYRKRAPIWESVTLEQWSDWKWQLKHKVTTIAEVVEVFPELKLKGAELEEAARIFTLGATPYYLALATSSSLADPILRQAIPCEDELHLRGDEEADPLAEDQYMPVPGLTHRYPDRVLLYTTHHCAMYCRHCNRRRKVGDPSSAPSKEQLLRCVDYVREHPEVRDILVSGGDPLTLADSRLDWLLGQLRAIPHLEIIRIATRIPVTLPQRITEELGALLKKYHPIYVSTHFNHVAECTPESGESLRRLADYGCVVNNQMVLLRGVNEDPSMVKKLNQWLLKNRCRPYYIFQCDSVEGVGHFKTPIATGTRLIDNLRGWTSGLAVPHYVVDLPKGGGKVSVQPDYCLESEGGRYRFRNYNGEVYEYVDGVSHENP
ncbi:MAG: KamA family radical SAM protein [Myxococcota bacterium]|nr:KamA family radical SAM protein [Myxococcota bacterium]